jgi:hypothetical protein
VLGNHLDPVSGYSWIRETERERWGEKSDPAEITTSCPKRFRSEIQT